MSAVKYRCGMTEWCTEPGNWRPVVRCYAPLPLDPAKQWPITLEIGINCCAAHRDGFTIDMVNPGYVAAVGHMAAMRAGVIPPDQQRNELVWMPACESTMHFPDPATEPTDEEDPDGRE